MAIDCGGFEGPSLPKKRKIKRVVRRRRRDTRIFLGVLKIFKCGD